MFTLSDFGDSAIAREAAPSKLNESEIDSIQNLIGSDEKILCAADCFSIEWLASNDPQYIYPRVHHHWIAISKGLLVIGNFYRQEIDSSYYKRDKTFKTWYKIIHHRSGLISLPSVRTSDISNHTAYSLNSISQISMVDGGVDAETFSEGFSFNWRWVLDSNGIQSRHQTSHLALNRLSFMSDSNHEIDVHSFHEELQQIGALLQKSVMTMKVEIPSDSQISDKALDVGGLEKLTELYKDGSLTAEEFSIAKRKILG